MTRPLVSGAPTTTGANALICDKGTWTGSPTGYTYLWERGMRQATTDGDPSWAPINGASGQNYVPTPDDAGARVRCRVIAANFKGTGEAVSLSKRTDPSRPFVVQAPTVTGFPAAGETVTCNPGVWTNNPTYSYQWYRAGVGDIPGATSESYTLKRRYSSFSEVDPDGDGNRKIGCRVVADNDVGNSDPSSSAERLSIDGAPLPLNQPTMTLENRTNNIGRKATCTPGSFLNWTSDEPEFSVAYSWLRDDQVIVGAVAADYVLTADDLGRTIRCRTDASNARGTGGRDSRAELIPLPTTRTEPSQFKVRTRGSQFDPVNMMVLPQAYAGALVTLIQERLTAEVDAEKKRCAALGSLPAAPTAAKKPTFPLSIEVRCAILVKDPTGYNISYNGVQWTRGQFCTVGAEQGSGACPDMGFVIPPIDPSSRAATLDPALEARLKATEPEKVLWDLDGNGRTDLVCPGSAPVARTLYKPGRTKVNAIITFADSATTGRYGVINEIIVDVPGYNRNQEAPQIKLRDPSQPMWCRTSVVPPPDPKTGPCTDRGEVGGIKLEGNLCPINLRATDQRAFDGLDQQVIDVLDRAAVAVAEAEKDQEEAASNPKLVRKSTKLMLSRAAPEVPAFNPLKPGDVLPGRLQRVSETVLISRQYASSLVGLVTSPPNLLALRGSESYVADAFKKAIPNFDEEKGQFALDQIYSVKGNLSMNGVTIDPVDDLLPTLIVPSDAGEAIPYVNQVKSMTVNAKNAVTKMAVDKIKDGIRQTVGDIPLSPRRASTGS